MEQRQRAGLDAMRSELVELRSERDGTRACFEWLAAATEAENLRQHAELERSVAGHIDSLEAELDEVREALDEHNGLPAESVAYRALVRRVQRLTRRTVPDGSTVAVVSKGDEALLQLDGCTGWHFPRAADGAYAGYYPFNGLAAVAQLESVRARGAAHLVLPSTALWWLERYPEFARHLKTRYPESARDEETCIIWSLEEAQTTATGVAAGLEAIVAECHARLDRPPAVLDWQSELDLAQALPQLNVITRASNGGSLPYVDESVDVVAVSSPSAAAEAARVAGQAVIVASGRRAKDEPGFDVRWKSSDAIPRLPSTSIVIPVYEQIEHTESCLRTLRETLPVGFEGEVILVDDASSAACAARLDELAATDTRITLLRNDKNLGFLGSSNRGASAARGDCLLFLNNDTVLLPGWLPPLLRLLRDRPDAGVVGGRLLFEDGRIQEAGGIVFRDGSAAHYGRNDPNLDDPLYNYVREVDYCSGALFATRRTLFEELGGFDECYAPGYYEDGDYCFGVRSRGYRVYYQPAATIVHIEGATGGTDLTRGAKRYQVVNQATLVEKWRDALRLQLVRPDAGDLSAWRALALRDWGGP